MPPKNRGGRPKKYTNSEEVRRANTDNKRRHRLRPSGLADFIVFEPTLHVGVRRNTDLRSGLGTTPDIPVPLDLETRQEDAESCDIRPSRQVQPTLPHPFGVTDPLGTEDDVQLIQGAKNTTRAKEQEIYNETLHNVALNVDLKLCVMTPPQSRPEACHNCRRRRLKCDRSLPQCLKCIKGGQECLGYQRLFRWDQGVASRGKMAGMTFEEVTKDRARHENLSLQLPSPANLLSRQFSRGNTKVSPLGSLMDPLVQDLNHASRKYLYYCELPLPSCLDPDTNQYSYYSC